MTRSSVESPVARPSTSYRRTDDQCRPHRRYWEVGRRIVEFEQRARSGPAYGEKLWKRLAADLTSRHGRGFSKSNIALMRRFTSNGRFSRRRLENSSPRPRVRLFPSRCKKNGRAETALKLHPEKKTKIVDSRRTGTFDFPWQGGYRFKREVHMASRDPRACRNSRRWSEQRRSGGIWEKPLRKRSSTTSHRCCEAGLNTIKKHQPQPHDDSTSSLDG